MDIHKPKAWNGLREFLKEYLIIVAGVLTALAGEQGVEWLHWRGEVAEARVAIRNEVALSMGNLLTRKALAGCVDRRIADLEAWLDSYAKGPPRQPAHPIGRMIFYGTTRQAWDMFNSTPAALHMATRERDAIGRVYAGFEAVRTIEAMDQAAWFDLQDFDGAPPLDVAARMRLRGLIGRIKLGNAGMLFIIPGLLNDARNIGVKPSTDLAPAPTNLGGRDMTNGLCAPLFG